MKTSIITKAKMKVNSVAACAVSSLSAGLATIGLGFCDVEVKAGESMKRFIKLVFNVLMFGGIIMAAIGAVMLVRTIISMASGEQAQPGALGKGIGLLLGGIFLMSAKFLVETITNTKLDQFDFMKV